MRKNSAWAGAIWLKQMVRLLVALMVLSAVAGCMGIRKEYIDSAYENTDQLQIARRAEPHKWRLVAEFSRNGSRRPDLDEVLMTHVERVITSSGLAVLSTETGAPELKVVVNNVFDPGSTAGKGILSGMTLCLIGVTSTDRYEMQITLSKGNAAVIKGGYRHTLFTNFGLIVSKPSNAVLSSDAFGKIIEQMLLAALRDLETDSQAISISSALFESHSGLILRRLLRG